MSIKVNKDRMGYKSLNEVGIPRTILIDMEKKKRDKYLLEQDVPAN